MSTPALLDRPAACVPAADAVEPASVRFAQVFLLAVVVLDLGLGKPFAYLRFGPLFVGDLMMVVVLVLLAARGVVRLRGIPASLLLLLGFTGGQVFLEAYAGADALESVRNWAVVYYVVLAVAAFSACDGPFRERTTERLVAALPRIAMALLFLIAARTVLDTAGLTDVTVLGTRVPIYKPTEVSIALVLIVVLWTRRLVPSWLTLGVAVPLLLVACAQSRSVILAVAAVALVMLGQRRLQIAVAAFLLILLAAAAVDLRIPTAYREISARQLTINAISIVSTQSSPVQDDKSLDQNKSWRLRWWTAVADDVRSRGLVFGANGWDTNLADEYGFQTASASSSTRLRSPHNAFVGVLGRGGAVAALLWALLYLSVLVRLAFGRRRLSGRPRLIADLALVAASVCLVHGMTDVFLESPQNAIPLWVLVGAGLAQLSAAGDRDGPAGAAP